MFFCRDHLRFDFLNLICPQVFGNFTSSIRGRFFAFGGGGGGIALVKMSNKLT
jgi:hypothetical protein